MLQDFDVELDWRGFELHPETPPGGMDLAQVFGPARARQMREYMRQFAASFGITDMGQPTHMPNTRRALAAAEYARDQGLLTEFRHRAMDAYWREARDLEDPAAIASVASAAGLDGAAAAAAMDASPYLARVDAMRAEATRAGVTGIPTFFFGSVPPDDVTAPLSRDNARGASGRSPLPIPDVVVGCQPYPLLAAAAERAGAQRRKP